MPVQWWPHTKLVRGVGLDLCSFCHEWATFGIYERSTTIRFMYLVPLAEVSRKKLLICERCHHIWELPAAEAAKLLAEAKGLPESGDIVQMWEEIDQAAEACDRGRPLHQVLVDLQVLRQQMYQRRPESHVDYVFQKFGEHLKSLRT